MRAKVMLIDEYTGRSLNLVCKVDNVACGDEPDRYEYNQKNLSDGQRKKIEDFFGKENAYHTKAEIVTLYNV